MTELKIDDQDQEFQSWVADQDLNPKEKQLWNFHKWMRQETDLNSGTIIDYRKYVAEMLDEDGILTVAGKDIESSHRHAAYTKYLKFKRSREESTNSTGETE